METDSAQLHLRTHFHVFFLIDPTAGADPPPTYAVKYRHVVRHHLSLSSPHALFGDLSLFLCLMTPHSEALPA